MESFRKKEISWTDYYPYGMNKPGRQLNPTDYKFGFNGMEKDNETQGTGNTYNFGARLYNSRLGRWMKVDPLAMKYPYLSPYHSMANNPILYVDPDGMKNVIYIHIDKDIAKKYGVKVEDIKNEIREAIFECSPLGMTHGIVFVEEIMEKEYLDPSDASASISDLVDLREKFPGRYNATGWGSTPTEESSPAGVSVENTSQASKENDAATIAWTLLHEVIHRLTQNAGKDGELSHENIKEDGSINRNNMISGRFNNYIEDKSTDELIDDGFYNLTPARMNAINEVVEPGAPKDNASERKSEATCNTNCNQLETRSTYMDRKYSKTTGDKQGNSTTKRGE